MKTSDTLARRAGLLARKPGRSTRGAIGQRLENLAAHLLRQRLSRLRTGGITLIEDGKAEHFGEPAGTGALHASIHITARRFYPETAFGGSVGAGESFIAGDWQCDDLTALVRILLVNRDVLDGLDSGWSRLSAPARQGLHWLARNTRGGSRRNIAAHYDIGNDFFACFLDPTLMYSCAIFEHSGMSLEQAQIAKLDRLCRKLDLQARDHLLEIGTGWGSLAMHAARHYGCRVTTTTISRAQHALALERIEQAGLRDRITVCLADYRDLSGRFDKLVSVEMIEAIGHQYFDTFFRHCHGLLRPGGTMVLQAITIDDRLYPSARDSVDFIKRHVFPGCCIPSVSALTTSMVRASGLRLVDLEDIGPHYATTLAAWRDNLLAHADQIRAAGYPEALLRLWQFYLAYCEGGFIERTLGDVQMVLQDNSRPVRPTPRL